MNKFKPGDYVRIRNGQRVWVVAQIRVPGEYAPLPSTYLVRIRLPEGGQELVYGDRALELAE